MSKRGQNKNHSQQTDQLPPHSVESEQGVLGCCLIAPSLIGQATEKLPIEAFYDLRHQAIYSALCEMARRRLSIDTITLFEKLKDQIEIQYLSALPDLVPSVVNLPSYLDTVWELWQRRKTIQICGEITDRAQNFDGQFKDFEWATRTDLSHILNGQADARQVWTVQELNDFDPDKDPNAIIGIKNGVLSRYLCRSYGAWLIAPSGIGKSSFINQLAFSWGLGRDVFGIQPVRPLRVLVIQAENDEGDQAEMAQGVLRTLDVDGFSTEMDQLNENVRFITERCTVGEQFCHMMEREIVAHKADVTFADPLMSFTGIDVTRLDQCSKFLRQHLNPVLVRTGSILFGAHHTGKPKFDRHVTAPTAIDYAYAGIGSSELVNWARAVMVLLQMKDGQHFELKLAKRGARAGARHPDREGEPPGEFTTSIFLRHARDRIYWEQVEPPEESDKPEGSPPKVGKPNVIRDMASSNLHSYLAACPPQGENLTEAAKRLENWIATETKKDVSLRSCQRIIPLLVENQKLTKKDGLYHIGTNA